MPQFIYVTSRDRRDLYQDLTIGFEGHQDIRVIVDRRRGERRVADALGDMERRRGLNRRQHRELDMELHSMGSFVTDAQAAWR